MERISAFEARLNIMRLELKALQAEVAATNRYIRHVDMRLERIERMLAPREVSGERA